MPLSTEILESSFGLYKQLERQHSKGGFTTLLAAFLAASPAHAFDLQGHRGPRGLADERRAPPL